jgi:plastocyanin
MEDTTRDRNNQTEAPPKETIWRQWMMVSIGLTALMSVLAIIVSMVALGSTSASSPAPASAATSAASAPAAAPPPTSVKMIVKSDSQHGRKGPDGAWHDAFLPADFQVRAGQTVNVTVVNYDTGPHTFTAPTLGVNAVIPAATGNAPAQYTFKFTAPSQAGSYQWWCSDPCDPWAMGHQGYMQGTVTVGA